ncbi:MAG: putative glycoside hydrolase [Candidatus Pacebacteria bacterium]|nr:putative glycoside hydrolase [Candidatus Paceibacterota bacterium]
MKIRNKKTYTYGGVAFVGILIVWFVVPAIFATSYSSTDPMTTVAKEESKEDLVETTKPIYVETPEQVKTIYMTACVAGTPSFRDDLVEIVEDTEVNSIIIDIKDFSGGISFDTENEILKPYISDRCGALDMREFVRELNEKGVYVIGRITVFQDPLYAKYHPEVAVQKEGDRSTWSDYKKVNYIDPGAKDFWKYILELSLESYDLGFDELNFDYIRFPSDGPMKDIYYPISESVVTSNPETGKAEVVRSFFQFLNEELREKRDIPISADIFGMTTTNTDDLNIGQILEYTLPYFDYVAPMVYPSHYPKNFNGWANPNEHVYEVVNFSMKSAYDRTVEYKNATTTPKNISKNISPEQLRTWIQDFDYGGDYDVPEIRDQIKASYDAGVKSWMIWSPSNRYTIGALEK